ncbi:MAG: VWA domain-containing protein [Spirochaetes bacterium]|nr:VWA domain-containing protein [Spirochaetota bacterium]
MIKKVVIALNIIILYVFFENFNIFSQNIVENSGISLRIDQIIFDNFPNIYAYVSVYDSIDNKPLHSLLKSNFTVYADGKEITSNINTENFYYTEEPINYSVIISSNGLMSGFPIEYQQKACVSLMESLREQDRISLYLYGEEVKTIFEFEKKNEMLLEKISKVEVLGFNPRLYDVLIYTARRLCENKIKRRVILIMSDGREVGSKYNKDQVLSILSEVNVPVYSIGMILMNKNNLNRLASISDNTGGGYIYTWNIENLPSIINILNEQIKMSYLLKFKINKIKGDDEFHQIEIRVQYKNKEARFTKNFIAKKIPIPIWIKITLTLFIIALFLALIILLLISRKIKRKKIGISNRKCTVCRRRMKDSWDECIFCKYLPVKNKKKY